MKKSIVITVFFALLISISFLFYNNSRTIFLPYLDFEGAQISHFFTKIRVVEENEKFESFVSRNADLKKVLEAISHSAEGSNERRYLQAFNSLLGERMVAYSSRRGRQSSYIIAAGAEGGRSCIVVNVNNAETDPELAFPPESTMHKVMSLFSGQCNKNQDLAANEVSYWNYLNYTVFQCFGGCEERDGIVYKNRVANLSEIEREIKKELLRQESQYQSLDRNMDDVEVNNLDVYFSGRELVVTFMYENPVIGEISSDARLEVLGSGELKLVSVGKPDGLISYFVAR